MNAALSLFDLTKNDVFNSIDLKKNIKFFPKI